MCQKQIIVLEGGCQLESMPGGRKMIRGRDAAIHMGEGV